MTDVEAARATILAAVAAAEAGPALANYLVRGDSLADGVASRVDFERDVAAEVIVDVMGFAGQVADRELLPYDPSYQVSAGQALVDDLTQVPHLAAVHALITGPDPELDTGGKPVVALAHRVDGPTGQAIVAYRVKGPGIATRRASGLRILVPRRGVYERIDAEIVYYQPRFDVLVVDGVVVVTAPTTLQRALGSDSRARAMARQTFAAATTRLDIDGAAELAEAVASDPAMIAKMAQLSRTIEADPSYAEALTTERLVAFLDANPQIPIVVAGEGDQRRLVFEASPQKRYLIPKVLADDFLRSELTQRQYEAGSKQRIDG